MKGHMETLFLLFSFFFFYTLLKRILRIVRKIEGLIASIGVPTSVEFTIIHDGQSRKVTHMFLKITQKLPVSVAFKDSLGNAAQVDGKPAWAVDNAALATVQVADDGLSAVVVPTGTVGSFKLQVSADADLGEGVKTILGELPIDLVSGEAVAVELTAGAPVDL
jgi:hypothetical protein